MRRQTLGSTLWIDLTKIEIIQTLKIGAICQVFILNVADDCSRGVNFNDLSNFNFVNVKDLHETELNMLGFCENESFQKEILRLQKGNPVPKNSTILSLDPTFTDKLLRAGGCLKSTELSLKCYC